VARILLVDDSAGARALIGARLRDEGYEVDEVAFASEAASAVLARPPDVVVTDLWMPGISGLQLCRLLRAEAATAWVPIVLLSASNDRKSRFWARHAGASAYVTKTEIDRLVEVLQSLVSPDSPPHSRSTWAFSVPPQGLARGTVQERLSQLLDLSLFETTLAGEVRALAHHADDVELIFEGLSRLASDVASYRWLSLVTENGSPASKTGAQRMFIHTHPDLREVAEREVRDALGIAAPVERRSAAENDVWIVTDARAVNVEWSAAPIVRPVTFGEQHVGQLAFAPSRRGASHEDKRLVEILAADLGGPLRMESLVGEARRLASTDSLTGLLNRRAFLERVGKLQATRADQLHPTSLLLLDVDHFKKVNDSLGHDAGDAVLQGVARVLSSMARRSDFVARWGGEEFVLCLAGTAEAGARVAAERVRRAIAEARYRLPNGEEHQATASIGLASTLQGEWDIHELLSRADKAMYNAKNRGRNRVETA